MQLRVISGSLGNRRFDSPGSFTTHPMGDRVRSALFNMLGDISGLEVLDPFAGSGALSFEAISRGATRVVAIERDRRAQGFLARNIAALGVSDHIQLIRGTCTAWSNQHPTEQFDLILCDPPYHDLQLGVIAKLARHLKPEGLLVLSHASDEIALIPGTELIKERDDRSYAKASLSFYRRVEH